jgi:hypothetical protein
LNSWCIVNAPSRVATPVHHTRLGGAAGRGAASAQQHGRVRRIGWLMDKDESDSVVTTYKAGLAGAVGLARVDRGPKPAD